MHRINDLGSHQTALYAWSDTESQSHVLLAACDEASQSYIDTPGWVGAANVHGNRSDSYWWAPAAKLK